MPIGRGNQNMYQRRWSIEHVEVNKGMGSSLSENMTSSGGQSLPAAVGHLHFVWLPDEVT